MPDLTPTAMASLRRLRRNFLEYAPSCLKIRAKSGAIEPFELNRAQLYIHERLEAQKAEMGWVRALLVKGRQQGASTYIGGRFYWRVSLNGGIKCFILTHLQDATDNLFGMVERFHEHSPLRPSTGAASAKELRFDKLDSGYAVGTAGSQAVGRSDTLQLVHGSEAAFWKNAASHFAGVIQAVPLLPGTEVIIESTANGVGGEFHGRCLQALAGIGDYQLIFCPWFWQDEYRRPAPEGFQLDEEEREYLGLHASAGCTLEHMVWRRNKILELKDPLLFKQEYPATVHEAFQTTGHDSLIKAVDVLKARKANLAGLGPLVIGVDPKREGKDRFSIAWRKGRKVLKVESDARPIDNVRAASKLRDIIDQDSPARVFIDAGGGGGIYDILCSWGEKYQRVCRLISFGGAPFHAPKKDLAGKAMYGPQNRRVEMWCLSNDWLRDEGGADIPDSDSLQADACAPGFTYDPVTGVMKLESKEHMARDRGIPSTDEWDSIVLTFAEPVSGTPAAKKLAMPELGIV